MASPQKKIIFKATDVAARLRALKESSAPGTNWWAPALTFEWASVRTGNNAEQWGNVTFRNADGVSGNLNLRIANELVVGTIMPTDAGLVEMQAQFQGKPVKIEARGTKKPTISINKWAAAVKTEENGVTLVKGADGKPILPPDSARSPYFAVAELVNEAFAAEARQRLELGDSLIQKVKEMAKATGKVDPQAVLDAFAAEHPRQGGDMILDKGALDNVRRMLNEPADLLRKGAIVVPAAKVAALWQEYISDKATKNRSMPLPNPMARISLSFDQKTGKAQMSFFDKSKPYADDKGKPQFEEGTVDGVPINADNIHKFIPSRSIVDGIIKMDSICFSAMGISMPVKAEILVVQQPVNMHRMELSDVYDEDSGSVVASSAAATPAAGVAATSAAATSSAPAAPTVATGDYDEMLNGLVN